MTFQPGDIVKHKNFPGAVAVVVEDIPDDYAVYINWVLPPAVGAYFRRDHPDCDYVAASSNLTLIQKGESK